MRLDHESLPTRTSTPRSSHFPYTTLFRSAKRSRHHSAFRETGSLCCGGLALSCRGESCKRTTPCFLFICARWARQLSASPRSEEHTSELQSRGHLVCRLLLEKKKQLTHER